MRILDRAQEGRCNKTSGSGSGLKSAETKKHNYKVIIERIYI